MYISLNWLKEFVKLPSKLSAADIVRELTDHTVEVEGTINQAEQFKRVVIGKVLTVNKHPNADRLRLALVDIKKEKLNIVCGAPNLAEGQLVPVALVGAVLPNGLEIKESEIRGEKSQGMICAEDELGIGKNHDGIIVLPEEARVGEDFAKYLKADDIVLEVDNKSLSNRPDLLSHYGIARELGVIFDLTLKPYEKFFSKDYQFLSAKENSLEVKVEDKDACPRYLAVKISNFKVLESPQWLKEKLVAVNQKPINNIVDLTNYVMLECGQPLHAFAADKLNKIVVRRGHKHETLETLDEKERVVDENDLLITDGKNPLALAGIMGGKDSGIKETTTSLILEAANFKATVIRKTSQKLGLRTEASTRYEKSLDPQLSAVALFRFIELLKKICPEIKIESSLIDIDNSETKIKEIDLDLNWLNKKIGQDVSSEQVVNILERLGFGVKKTNDSNLAVTVPSWRATKDVSNKEDLVEEVLRIYGYDKIESQLPVEELRLPEVNQERKLERKIKDILALKHGLTEVYNYSFVGADQLKKLNINFFNHLKLVNPLSDLQTMLRQSLVPGLVSNIKNNQAKAASLGFFEFGLVFFNAPGNLKKEQNSDDTIPYQEKRLALAVATDNGDILAQAKDIVNNLLQNLISFDVETKFSVPAEFPGWADQNATAKIIISGEEVGVVGLISKEVSGGINLKKQTALVEINFNALAELIFSLAPKRFIEPAKYPTVERDLAFVLNEKILYNEVKDELLKFDSLIKEVELFDVYSGNKLAADEKSLAFHLSFSSKERTLTATEVDEIISRLVTYLKERFSARLRD